MSTNTWLDPDFVYQQKAHCEHKTLYREHILTNLMSFKIVSISEHTARPAHGPGLQDAMSIFLCSDATNLSTDCFFKLIQVCKPASFKTSFDAGVEPKVTWHEIWWIGWMFQDPLASQKQIQVCQASCMRRGIVHMDVVSGAWPLGPHGCPQSSQNLHKVFSIDHPVPQKFEMHHPLPVKECDD